MSPFGQLGNVNVSLLQNKQEAALALAHINFDFSLVKYEAPIEFQGLGASLSKQRKKEAEDGSTHLVARKLGALFESDLPVVKSLTQAYGRRVTEIAEMPSVNPKGTKSDGAFADLVGADGTTIWAAATSGHGVMAIHLLACILARIWSRSEAVSIWEELVEQRKVILAQEVENASTFPASVLRASRIDLSRDQLANWDAGARAWLRTADEAKKLQQTQLKLVIDNISLSVSEQANVYSSVMKTWTNALSAINKIVEGQPQRIQDGGILLALSSWHLYPDMSVFDKESHIIMQNDALIPQGGMISLGLQNNRGSPDDGVWWSLPLAHMRYYGEPIVSTRNSGVGNAQVTFDQFLFVALGSVLSTWDVPAHNIEPAMTVIMHLGNVYGNFDNRRSKTKVYRRAKWLRPLSRISHAFTSLPTEDREELRRLIFFGMRRCPKLFGEAGSYLSPVFGLTNIQLILGSMLTMEDKINLLRHWAAYCNANLEGALIRYRSNGPLSVFHLTTLYPTKQPDSKRKRHSKKPQQSEVYQTWSEQETANGQWIGDQVLDSGILEVSAEPTSESFSRQIPAYETKLRSSVRDQAHPWDQLNERPSGARPSDPNYELFFGNPADIAIFRPKSRKGEFKRVCNHLDVVHLLRLAESGIISYERLVVVLLEVVTSRKQFADYFDCLDVLARADELYAHLL
ncbi:MAG: hypothetical protein Q9225_004519 [Loekoesia sp. 1 TL-2023]